MVSSRLTFLDFTFPALPTWFWHWLPYLPRFRNMGNEKEEPEPEPAEFESKQFIKMMTEEEFDNDQVWQPPCLTTTHQVWQSLLQVWQLLDQVRQSTSFTTTLFDNYLPGLTTTRPVLTSTRLGLITGQFETHNDWQPQGLTIHLVWQPQGLTSTWPGFRWKRIERFRWYQWYKKKKKKEIKKHKGRYIFVKYINRLLSFRFSSLVFCHISFCVAFSCSLQMLFEPLEKKIKTEKVFRWDLITWYSYKPS